MFRKHQGSELNQHIRVIQRLVPGRQHFIHNPIHLSSSISPLVALLLQNDLGHLPAAASFSGWCSFLIEHWPEFLTKLRLNLYAVLPSLLPPFLSSDISCVHTLPLFLFLYPTKIGQNMSKRYVCGLFLPGVRKNIWQDIFSFLISAWGNNFRTISLNGHRSLQCPESASKWRLRDHFKAWHRKNLRDNKKMPVVMIYYRLETLIHSSYTSALLILMVSPSIDTISPHLTDKNTETQRGSVLCDGLRGGKLQSRESIL